ncbi:membrane-associated protein, putative [Bodo saltans]|uniref:Membrane-associated protein, putative n=1 Tax=Bodo saltans TaxID=75058 RepID=A0A0S4JMF0_BODSA|nr:membrane-associated protein, putative [Bodo saltans]|eukprot:CUG91080.1 membrane-associated protein, putative [Bodo saltans]
MSFLLLLVCLAVAFVWLIPHRATVIFADNDEQDSIVAATPQLKRNAIKPLCTTRKRTYLSIMFAKPLCTTRKRTYLSIMFAKPLCTTRKRTYPSIMFAKPLCTTRKRTYLSIMFAKPLCTTRKRTYLSIMFAKPWRRVGVGQDAGDALRALRQVEPGRLHAIFP